MKAKKFLFGVTAFSFAASAFTLGAFFLRTDEGQNPRAVALRNPSGNLSDPLFNERLAQARGLLRSLEKVCVDSQGEFKGGYQYPEEPLAFLGAGAVDCDGQLKNLGFSFGLLQDYVRSGNSSFQQTTADYWKNHAGTARPIPNLPELRKTAAFVLSEAQSHGYRNLINKLDAEDCPQSLAEDNAERDPASKRKRRHRRKSSTQVSSVDSSTSGLTMASVVRQMDSILLSERSCQEKKISLAAIFKRATAQDLENRSWVEWAGKNIDRLARNAFLRHAIAASTVLNPMTKADHNEMTTNPFIPPTAGHGPNEKDVQFSQAAVHMKMAALGVNKDALRHFGLETYADFDSLGAESKKAILLDSVQGLTGIAYNGETRSFAVDVARDECDKKIGRIFGNEFAVAAASGVERINGGVLEVERFHLIASMHLYPDNMGRLEDAPVFIPSGWTSPSRGNDVDNASYSVSYAKLGNYRNVSLNLVHLKNPERLMNFGSYPIETNDAGSVRVGTIGGPGSTTDGSYLHNHIMIWQGGKRLNFVDTFCK